MPARNSFAKKTNASAFKNPSVFWRCLIAGFSLISLAFGFSVYCHATKVNTFEKLLVENVDYRLLGTNEESLRSFAKETIHYLTGEQEGWNPQITVAGFPAGSFIPQSFRDHMETVKNGFAVAKNVFWVMLGLVSALLLGGIGARSGHRFSRSGYYTGASAAIAVIIAIGLWAYFDFNSLWQLLHKYFITDGIFSATEHIMQFFPISVFAGYLPPVMLTFGLLALAALILPRLPIFLLQGVASKKKR